MDEKWEIEFAEKMETGDVDGVRQMLMEHPQYLHQYRGNNSLLHIAARRDNVEMVAMLVELGLDVDVPALDCPDGPIYNAAIFRANKVARWLLEHGAKINFEVNGEIQVGALASACQQGNLELVKLLVDHGADINAAWGKPRMNPLMFAVMYGKTEVADYLRSKGAKLLEGVKEVEPETSADTLLEHITKHLGKPKPLALQQIVSGDPPIVIHMVPPDLFSKTRCRLTLVTAGMSDRPMTVPKKGKGYQYAELVMYLPDYWQYTKKALKDPNNFWPFEWLLRIARYPHENKTWLGGASVVIANGEPPKPFAPDTKFTCMLAVTEESDFGRLKLPDGRSVVFYTLFPLYTEERDLEKKKGTEHLLKLFQKHKIGTTIDLERPNVAKPARRGK